MTEAMLDAALKFLGCENCRRAGKAELFQLQKAQLDKIPYTNLPILVSGEPDLSMEAVFDRLILRQMGGYCFELNCLLAGILRALGFEVTEYFGRWHFGITDPVPPARHRMMVVTLPEGKFIADAGVASIAPVEPLAFEYGKIQNRPYGSFRLQASEKFGTVVETLAQDEWKEFYSFPQVPAFARDFEYVNYHCSTHETSVFRKKFFAVHQNESCHVSIENPSPETPYFQLVRRSRKEKNSRRIGSEAEFKRILRDEFRMGTIPEKLPELLKFD
ncbi:MAG: arylamine N-acetyltransferase [Lentisphaeria bacterium]|nr:arylamine N-acetyltransferase [Lentisphaeria bacterium]